MLFYHKITCIFMIYIFTYLCANFFGMKSRLCQKKSLLECMHTTAKELWSNAKWHHWDPRRRANFSFGVQCFSVVRNTFGSASLVEQLRCIVRPKRGAKKLQLSSTKSLQKQLCRFLRKFSAPQSSPQSALYVHPHHTLTHRPQSGAPISLTFSSDTKGFFHLTI